MIELFEDRDGRGLLQHLRRRLPAWSCASRTTTTEPSRPAIPSPRWTCCGSRRSPATPAFRETAERTLAAFARKMSEQPAGLPQMLVAYQWSIGKPMQVILAGDRRAPDTRALAAAVHRRFLPNRVVAMASDAGPEARAMNAIDGRADSVPL